MMTLNIAVTVVFAVSRLTFPIKAAAVNAVEYFTGADAVNGVGALTSATIAAKKTNNSNLYELKFTKRPQEAINMKDQHEKIKGYRDLSQEEIDLMNEGKALAEQCGDFIAKLEDMQSNDQRAVALGKTNLQQGFMWAIRSVARPTTF